MRYTAKLTVHAVINSKIKTFKVLFVPSSRRRAATAATHGILSREKLIKLLWETDCFIEENTLTVNVGRLRKKLESAGLEDFIATRFGMGYIIE